MSPETLPLATGANPTRAIQLAPTYAEVRVLVWPLDPAARHRSAVALHDSYAGLISAGVGEGGETGTDELGEGAAQWRGQRYIKDISGPLEWIRFAPGFRVERGVGSAPKSKPQSEVCGWTIRPAFVRLHSTIEDPPKLPGAPDYDLRPNLPTGEKVIEWKAQQGDKWERVIPIRSPLWAGLHHRSALANRAAKVKTQEKWGENAGASFVLDLDGVAFGHKGEPAIRIEWGNSWSLVFRGNGKTARPQLERKGADDNGKIDWRLAKRFDDAPALDENWWKERHTVTFYTLARFLIVSIDGHEFWYGEVDSKPKSGSRSDKLRPVRWKSSPLRVSLWGACAVIQLASVRFDRAAQFSREVSVGGSPLEAVNFTCEGNAVAEVPVPGAGIGAATGVPFVDAVIAALISAGRAQMLGTDLKLSKIAALWHEVEGEARIDYTLQMLGTRETAPLVTAFAAQFPPADATPLPTPIDLRLALDSVEVESGDPETLPSAQARFEVSVPMLERKVPGWKDAVLPFRPVQIQTNETGDDNWKTIFCGYLLPNAKGSEVYNGEHFSLTALDPTLRLKEPAALIDGRFAPLDLDLGAGEVGTPLYGGQAVQKLIGFEMGQAWARSLNGDGNWKRYFPTSHYALIDPFGDDYFRGGAEGNSPAQGGFLLPPPFGEDVLRWIGTLAQYDRAVFFYDPQIGEGDGSSSGAWVYGHADRIFKERGQIVHALHGSTTGAGAEGDKRLSAWPLLSSFSGQGLLEHAYTRCQIWGIAPKGGEGMFPALITGSATTRLPNTDPLSEAQSWPRTLLSRHEFIGNRVFKDYAQSLARAIWREFEGRAPRRFDFVLRDQIKVVRWGEKLNWNGEDLRILSSKMSWTFGENDERTTTITARALSATGL